MDRYGVSCQTDLSSTGWTLLGLYVDADRNGSDKLELGCKTRRCDKNVDSGSKKPKRAMDSRARQKSGAVRENGIKGVKYQTGTYAVPGCSNQENGM